MPTRRRLSTISASVDVRGNNLTQIAPTANSGPPNRSAEHLFRLAELVASGELVLPVDLPSDQLDQLVRQVRTRRRRRLVRYIARAIATDIHRSRESGK